MNYRAYKFLILSDYYRISEDLNTKKLIKRALQNGPYKYIFWMRTCSFTKSNRLLKYLVFPFAKTMLNHLKYKFGILVPYQTSIKSGFNIVHVGGVVVNPGSVIGKNCTLSQGVTIGQTNRGKYKGNPTIGDNVFIGPGAIVLGRVKIGNNVAIGANSVVTKDIPDYSVVVGIPGKVISQKGAEDYVNNTDYEDKIK